VNLAGIKILFRARGAAGKRILEALYDEGMRRQAADSKESEREPGTAASNT